MLQLQAKQRAEQVAILDAKTGGIAKNVTKSVMRGGTAVAVKKVPIVGLCFGLGLGLMRLVGGDFIGAACEVASGAVSMVPVTGTAGSFAMDAFIAGRDFNVK